MASPLKPRVLMEKRSSSLYILLVAYLSRASMASSPFMPMPLSDTRIRDLPPFSISIMMRQACASRAFSTSSLTTENGRSTTSPAAILLERFSGSILIFDMIFRFLPQRPQRKIFNYITLFASFTAHRKNERLGMGIMKNHEAHEGY